MHPDPNYNRGSEKLNQNYNKTRKYNSDILYTNLSIQLCKVCKVKQLPIMKIENF